MAFKKVLVGMVAVAGSACLAQPRAEAAQITVAASKDAMLFGTSLNADPSDTNPNAGASGRGPGLFAGADGSSNKKRSLIQFAMPSLPIGATVTRVEIIMYLGQIAGSGGGGTGDSLPSRTIRLYRLQQDWSEGNSGLVIDTVPPGGPKTTSPNIGGSGQGYGRQNGDTTWKYANFNTTPGDAVLWGGTGPGGNHNAAESGEATFISTTLSPYTVGAPYEWDSDVLGASLPVSAGLVSDVQKWIDGTLPNFGWEMISDLETTPTSFLGFWSRDGAGANTDAGSEPPVLRITYSVPEPASLAWAVAGGALALRRAGAESPYGECMKSSSFVKVAALALMVLGGLALWSTSPSSSSAEAPKLAAAGAQHSVRMAAIGGINDNDFLKQLGSRFEDATHIKVEIVASGNKGRAADVFRKGGIDLITTQSSEQAIGLVAEGLATDVQPWLQSDLALVGPESDPAKVKSSSDLTDALRRIAQSPSPFVVHDSSGAHDVLMAVAQSNGIEFAPDRTTFLLDDHQRRVLTIASERKAYTLIGRVPFLSGKLQHGGLVLMLAGDARLRVPYVLGIANPSRFPDAHLTEAKAFAAYLLKPETQAWIGEFGRGKWDDQPLFFPVAASKNPSASTAPNTN